VTDPTRPFLVLYIVWHPHFTRGAAIAESLREQFRRKLYENVAGGTGLSVIFRSTAPSGSSVPIPIDLNDAEATAVVVLAETNLAGDTDWVAYVRELAAMTDAAGLGRAIVSRIDRASGIEPRHRRAVAAM
jgi:hypothetical protein